LAHISERTGKYSEAVAKAALLANGWEVATPECDESYDIIGRDPVNGEFYRIQCKTIRQRDDRGGDLVVYAKKGDGTPYTQADADYIVGILAADIPRIYMFPVRGIGEYWAAEERASTRWIELPIELDRTITRTNVAEVAAEESAA
jgi:hypothetical protein